MTNTKNYLPETRELAELCGLIRNPTWDTGGEVYIEGDPLTKAAALFTPFTDWNDVHRVVGVLVERGLFFEWVHALTGCWGDTDGIDKGDVEVLVAAGGQRWATAALEVLRAAKEDKQ